MLTAAVSSVEDCVEAAGISVGGMGCEDVTCDCLSSVEDGVETSSGVSEVGMGCEDVS
jgi:hypothetical protein